MPEDYLERVGAAEREVRWHDRIAGAGRQVALAEREDDLVGVVSWSHHPSRRPPWQLASLYVAPGERRTGLGRRLLSYALGARPAYLWVFSENRRAQHFYADAGFRADGRSRVDPDTGLTEERWVRLVSPVPPEGRSRAGHDVGHHSSAGVTSRDRAAARW